MTVDQLITLITSSHYYKYLYHFTDKSNLASIREKGLVSKQHMRSEGWWPDVTGGSSISRKLDTNKGIDPYVSLSFTKQHKMKYEAKKVGRLLEPHTLSIRPEVLKIEGTKIAFGIANANDVEILPIADAIERLDVGILYEINDWSTPLNKKRLSQAGKFEILVPDSVPSNLIMEIF